ncbi:MAG: acyltransferase [Stigonema ocellatum SAG 48.90 = DSM 106950]|nr:acyltransferase [Stigonema ocellatum SAG 48.90 = DSM 106950]
MHISSNITPEIKQKISNNLYFVRGLAIFMVVVGHVIGNKDAGISQLYKQNVPILAWIHTFIYTFHMPIFFIASGISFAIFSKTNTNYIKFVKSRFFRLLLPWICWSPIYFILRTFSGKVNFSIFGILKAILSADFIFWFFPALTFASVLSFVVFQTIKNQKIYIFTSITLLILSFYIKTVLSVWFYFNIFYAFGFLTATNLAKIEQNSNKISPLRIVYYVFILLVTMLSVSYFFVSEELVKLFNGILGFYLVYILGSYDWSKLTSGLRYQPFNLLRNTIVYWGKISMSIYLIHVIFGSFTRTLLVKIGITDVMIQFAMGLFVSLFGSVLTHECLHNRSKLFLYSIGEAKS